MEKENKKQEKIYNPSDKEKEEITFIYKELDDMITARNEKYPQFNDRTLIQFMDDSNKRLQGYVPDRDSQDKEDWQSNVFNQATRNKTKALVASVASTPPKTPIVAKSTVDGVYDTYRGEYMEALVSHARAQLNPETQIFWEAWQGCGEGTIVKYIGYLKSVQKRKFIKSYNLETGEMVFDEKDVVVSDECVDAFVNLAELFIKNFYTHNIQDQPSIAWVRYLDKETTEIELGKYKNWKYCDGKNTEQYKSDTQTFFLQKFETRVDADEYEVIKYYNKSKDMYSIVCNGVLLLSAPLLWGMKKKYYPFAKSIFEPFSGREFFYGNSLPNANMDIQDQLNTLTNMFNDKIYRSLNPERLVGTKNKDLMELENDTIGMEDTTYVDDVNQVKWLENPGLTNSEFALIKYVGAQFDQGTVDPNQQGIASRGVTAREIVIANENAKKIKGIFFTFLSDLWIQKTKLTITNVLMHYPMAKIETIVGANGAEKIRETWPTYYIRNAEFPNGKTGTLAIQFVNSKGDLPSRDDLDIQEEMMKLKGINFNQVALTKDYFNDYEYEPEVVTDNLYQQDIAQNQAVFLEKLRVMMMAFPQIYEQNKTVLFEDFAKAFNDKQERYNLETPPPMPMGIPGGEEMPTETPVPSARVVGVQ